MHRRILALLLVFISCLIFPGLSAPDTEPETASVVEISLSFAGDCTLGWDVRLSYQNSFHDVFAKQQEALGDGVYAYFFEKVRDIFIQDDLAIVNMEGALTNSTAYNEKQFVFKGPPEYARILTEAGVGMVNMANNHTYDYKWKGYVDTLSALDEAEIRYYGADWPHMVEIDGVTVGFLGYTGWSLGIRGQITADIAKIRERGAELVIVSFHWGDERSNYPNATQTGLGRHAIDNGADLVIGHHPHVLQGIELYKDKYIVYSLGNFCFGGNRNPSDKDTMIFRAVFTFDTETRETTGISAYVIPCSVSSRTDRNDYQPRPLEGADAERVAKRIKEYSKPLNGGLDIMENIYVYNVN